MTAAIVSGDRSRRWPRLTNPRADATVAAYERIGELTHHDPNVLFLDFHTATPSMYHGQLSGDSWPNTDDLAAERLGGEPPAITAQERFDRDYASGKPSYFVVTDLASLKAEADLRALLDDRDTAVEKTAHVPRPVRVQSGMREARGSGTRDGDQGEKSAQSGRAT